MVNDLTGKKFGRLTVLRRADVKSRKAYWVCECTCGTIKNVRGDILLSGRTQSCGCYHRERKTTHHGSKSRLYKVWQDMLYRCEKVDHPQYVDWGGRGISVCPQWHTFEVFREWAFANGYDENAPRGECTIDRIDNDGNYEPTNCRWATIAIQNRNRRSNRLIQYNGTTHILKEWADLLGINKNTLHARIFVLGWSVERAFSTPTMTQFSRR